MATFTTNYNLRKPATSDFVTVASDINASMDTIDTELKDREDRLDSLEAPIRGKLIKNGTTQSISNTADTQVTFNSTEYNVGSIVDQANNRFTVPSGQGGHYIVIAQAKWVHAAGGGRSVRILQGANVLSHNHTGAGQTTAAGGGMAVQTVWEGALTAGQNITMQVWQDTAGSLDLTNNFGGTWFSIRKVA